MRTVLVACGLQLRTFLRTPVTVVLAVMLPLNLLLLLSLFALTGYRAPTGLAVGEDTALARAFVQALDDTHHSFELRPMAADRARDLLREGRLVALVEVPPGFEAGIRAGRTVPISVTLDNVNLDLAEDVRRALPAAAALFAERQGFGEVRVRPSLRNVLAKDTGYVEYLGVSALALAASIAGATLGGTLTAREWESSAVRLLQVAPRGPTAVLVGRLLAAALVACLATAVPTAVVWTLYDVPPVHPVEAIGSLVLAVLSATAVGGLVGAWLKRVLLVVPVTVGGMLPFYLDSGALEPQRLDGPWLFWAAHASPLYFSVGVAEHAFHGLVVTPEPVWVLLLALLAFGGAAVALLPWAARR